MKTEKATKPDNIDEKTWQENQRWVKLMSSQSEKNRQSLDPRLFRQSSKQHIIRPRPASKSQ